MKNKEKQLDVVLSPGEFESLRKRDLSQTVCVVFDVLRATSSIVTALGNEAEAIMPVQEISQALEIKRMLPDVLLAGERHGVRIEGELSGGVRFDFGNSPREFTKEKVQGKRIVTTTTNGTLALRASAHAKLVLASSFLNLQSTVDLIKKRRTKQLLLVCAGTFDECAYEDVLGAGAICSQMKYPDKDTSTGPVETRKITPPTGTTWRPCHCHDAASTGSDPLERLGGKCAMIWPACPDMKTVGAPDRPPPQ